MKHGDGVFVSETEGERTTVTFDAANAMTPDARTEAAAPVMASLRDAGVIGGWRDEMFPVNAGYGQDNLFLVERAAASLLGIRAYGVHINGYVRLPNGELELWVAKRSATKQTFPSKLDHLVAGGLPAGVPPGQCVIKECGEEASIPPELAAAARPVGIVSYAANYQVGLCMPLRVVVSFVVDIPSIL